MSDTLVDQLEAGIKALMAGDPEPACGPEVAALLRVASELRTLPDPEFRNSLKAELIGVAERDLGGVIDGAGDFLATEGS